MAVRGYKESTWRALKLAGGQGRAGDVFPARINVNEAIFLETVAAAALDARPHGAGSGAPPQAADHPILLTVPETLYLKCAILEVV